MDEHEQMAPADLLSSSGQYHVDRKLNQHKRHIAQADLRMFTVDLSISSSRPLQDLKRGHKGPGNQNQPFQREVPFRPRNVIPSQLKA